MEGDTEVTREEVIQRLELKRRDIGERLTGIGMAVAEGIDYPNNWFAELDQARRELLDVTTQLEEERRPSA